MLNHVSMLVMLGVFKLQSVGAGVQAVAFAEATQGAGSHLGPYFTSLKGVRCMSRMSEVGSNNGA